MIIAPVAAWILFAFVHAYEPSGTNRVIYGVEFAGVWVFALYWLCKTMELRDTNADQKFVPKALRPIT